MSWPWNPGQRSLKVIESGTIWKTGYGFLLVFYSNFVPKTNIEYPPGAMAGLAIVKL